MEQQKEYLSPKRHEEIKEELMYLKRERRKEIAEDLEHAKSLGDFSENAEYQEARDAQAQLESRIAQLETILQSAEIIPEEHSTGVVAVGSGVSVQNLATAKEYNFIIVGSEEVDIDVGKISVHSPVGQGLMGKKKGETVVINTPAGEVEYKIKNIK